jgi:predicted acetyltransferase
MSLTVRPLGAPAEIEAAFAVFLRSMVGLVTTGREDPVAFSQPGRWLGAFDGERLVGGADSYDAWLTVPGGARIPHAAVTRIGVLPTHTRRGLLTTLMTRQLRALRDEGVVAASLRASEGGIYERFGYGVATRSATLSVARREAVLRHPAAGCVRLDERSSPRAIHERVRWTGSVQRPDLWWRLHGHDRSEHLLAACGPAGHESGFVAYRPLERDRWLDGVQRTVAVDDLVAHDDATYAALVAHLLSLDLVTTIELPSRPVDDVLPALLTDPRAARVTGVQDETWLRLLDVEGALAARAYRAEGTVVLDVEDALLPENIGRYSVGPDHGSRTVAPADVRLDVAALAAAYLGDARWWQLHAAGRVIELTPGAIEAADRLFATERLPWAGTFF